MVVFAGLIFQRPFQKFFGTFASCMMPTARSKAGKVNSSIRFVKSFCRALQSRLVCFFLQAQSQSYLQNLICSFGSSVGEVSFRLSMLGRASTVFSIVSYLDIFQVKVFLKIHKFLLFFTNGCMSRSVWTQSLDLLQSQPRRTAPGTTRDTLARGTCCCSCGRCRSW